MEYYQRGMYVNLAGSSSAGAAPSDPGGPRPRAPRHGLPVGGRSVVGSCRMFFKRHSHVAEH